jgi:hypothetical protein
MADERDKDEFIRLGGTEEEWEEFSATWNSQMMMQYLILKELREIKKVIV